MRGSIDMRKRLSNGLANVGEDVAHGTSRIAGVKT